MTFCRELRLWMPVKHLDSHCYILKSVSVYLDNISLIHFPKRKDKPEIIQQ